MPNFTSKSYVAGDQSWLGGTHGIYHNRTETLTVSAFDKATHYPDGYIKSGFPVAKVDDRLVPYNAGGTGDAAVLAGHIYNDVAVKDDPEISVALFWHGSVRTNLVPLAGFAAPASQSSQITYR